ncbi:MAG TPA: protein kinase [Polyangiaceae bacterium]|nr:protein kinase [Polyangiaceae bacterium]
MSDDEAFRRRVGSTLRGKWVLDRLLGVGGMAAVYAATHKIGRREAIKILHAEIADSRELVERFEQEAHAVNRLKHPGAVEVRDHDVTEDGEPFLVMELLEGESLGARLQREPVPLGDALRYADELLDVLVAAHAAGIIHRDIKPDNLFLTREGRLKVLDFGIARMREGSPRAARTALGLPMGTPQYMPPEQVLGSGVDHRADLYAVGATLFRLVAGRHARQVQPGTPLLMKVLSEPAPPLCSVAPQVSTAVGLVVDRALALRPDDRYPDARTMQADVQALRRGEAPPFASTQPPARVAPTAAGASVSAKPAAGAAFAGGASPTVGPGRATGGTPAQAPIGYTPTGVAPAQAPAQGGYTPTGVAPAQGGYTPTGVAPAPAHAGHLPTRVATAPAPAGYTPTGVAPAPAPPGYTPTGVATAPAPPGYTPTGVATAPAPPGYAPTGVPIAHASLGYAPTGIAPARAAAGYPPTGLAAAAGHLPTHGAAGPSAAPNAPGTVPASLARSQVTVAERPQASRPAASVPGASPPKTGPWGAAGAYPATFAGQPTNGAPSRGHAPGPTGPRTTSAPGAAFAVVPPLADADSARGRAARAGKGGTDQRTPYLIAIGALTLLVLLFGGLWLFGGDSSSATADPSLPDPGSAGAPPWASPGAAGAPYGSPPPGARPPSVSRERRRELEKERERQYEREKDRLKELEKERERQREREKEGRKREEG